MKRKILQDILIALFGVLAIMALVLAVIYLFPSEPDGLIVQEEFTVSSSPITADGGKYECIVEGVLANPSGKTVEVTSMAVTASGETLSCAWLMDGGFTVPPRTSYPIHLKATAAEEITVISEIKLTGTDGEELPLKEESERATTLGIVLALIFFAFTGATVWAAKVRYYLWQEDKMKK